MPSLTALDLASRSRPMAEPKKWIKAAVSHPGALRAKAKDAGESTHEFAEGHRHASGKTGEQARLALTLMSLHGGEHRSQRRKALYTHPRSQAHG